MGPRPSQIRCHIAAGRHRRLMAVDDVRERPVSMDLYDSNGSESGSSAWRLIRQPRSHNRQR